MILLILSGENTHFTKLLGIRELEKMDITETLNNLGIYTLNNIINNEEYVLKINGEIALWSMIDWSSYEECDTLRITTTENHNSYTDFFTYDPTENYTFELYKQLDNLDQF